MQNIEWAGINFDPEKHMRINSIKSKSNTLLTLLIVLGLLSTILGVIGLSSLLGNWVIESGIFKKNGYFFRWETSEYKMQIEIISNSTGIEMTNAFNQLQLSDIFGWIAISFGILTFFYAAFIASNILLVEKGMVLYVFGIVTIAGIVMGILSIIYWVNFNDSIEIFMRKII